MVVQICELATPARPLRVRLRLSHEWLARSKRAWIDIARWRRTKSIAQLPRNVPYLYHQGRSPRGRARMIQLAAPTLSHTCSLSLVSVSGADEDLAGVPHASQDAHLLSQGQHGRVALLPEAYHDAGAHLLVLRAALRQVARQRVREAAARNA
eukprot:1703840-Pleurochrysis_carterae.AAC.2